MRIYLLETILEEYNSIKYAIPVIVHKRKILLGLSTANDWRNDKWCFVGGHIKGHENPYQAAIREAKEETNLDIINDNKAVIKEKAIYILSRLKGGNTKIKHNGEFSAMGFFDRKELKSLKLAKNTQEILKALDIY